MVGLTRIIGKFNVDYAGKSYDGEQEYQMVIITEFDTSNKEVERKVFYFKGRVPDLRIEAQIENIFREYPNYSKLIIAPTTLICRI